MKFKKVNYKIFEIISNAALSDTYIAEGRPIPGLVVSHNDNKDLQELIEYHITTPPGDINLLWLIPPFNNNQLILNIEFVKPMKLQFGIRFDIPIHYALVDGILQSRGFFLQTGKQGDKISDITPKILLEVPNMNIEKEWNRKLNKTIRKQYIKKGLTKREANIATRQQIETMREFWNIRR